MLGNNKNPEINKLNQFFHTTLAVFTALNVVLFNISPVSNSPAPDRFPLYKIVTESVIATGENGVKIKAGAQKTYLAGVYYTQSLCENAKQDKSRISEYGTVRYYCLGEKIKKNL